MERMIKGFTLKHYVVARHSPRTTRQRSLRLVLFHLKPFIVRCFTLKLTLLLTLLVPLSTQAQAINALTFDKERYYLSHAGQTESESFNQYFRTSENVSNWKKMMAVHYFQDTASSFPFDYASYMGASMQALYPNMDTKILRLNDDEAMLIFIIRAEKPQKMTEFNLYRFGKHFYTADVIALHFAFRMFGPLSEDFVKTINTSQRRWIKDIRTIEFPQIIYER